MYFSPILRVGALAISLILQTTSPALLDAPAAEAIILNEKDKMEMLWFARAIYSESKNREEQYLIAWVIRNRVESRHKGAESYQETVLARSQFSGLSSRDPQFRINVSLGFEDSGPGWDSAKSIAESVLTSGDTYRPIPAGVKHFYSPLAVTVPTWAEGEKPYLLTYNDDGKPSFAFYRDIK